MQSLHRLLARNGAAIDREGPAGWLNPPSPDCLSSGALAAPETSLWFQDFTAWKRFSGSGLAAHFSAFPEDSARPGQWVLFLPREKARLDMMIHCLAARLPDGGTLWLVGEKRAGIGSAGKRLQTRFESVEKIDSAGHGVLWCARRPHRNMKFDGEQYATRWRLGRPEGELEFLSWPGVFAHGALDEGTALLLDYLPDLPDGASLLDYGAGVGVITACLLQRNPTLKASLLDNNALACLSSEASLAANSMTARVLASDVFSEVSDRFDLIISNPPFHVGQRQDLGLGERFVREAGNFLNPGGQLLMVVNRHLPYPRWLEATFGKHRELASNQRYRVLQAQASSLQSRNRIERRPQ